MVSGDGAKFPATSGYYSLAADFFVEKALNPEQAEAPQFVSAGHNLLITRQIVACSQALGQRERSKSERGTSDGRGLDSRVWNSARKAGVGKLGLVTSILQDCESRTLPGLFGRDYLQLCYDAKYSQVQYM